MRINFYLVLLITLLTTASCGNKNSGHQSTNSSEDPYSLKPAPEWQQLMALDSTALSEEDRKNGYWGYALDEYGGELKPAELTEENIPDFWLRARAPLEFYRDFYTVDYVEAFRAFGVEHYHKDSPEHTVKIDGSLSCGTGSFTDDLNTQVLPGRGSVKISGELDNGVGTVVVDYDDCGSENMQSTGEVILDVEQRAANEIWPSYNTTSYYKTLQGNVDNSVTTQSGFDEYAESYDEGIRTEVYRFSSLVYKRVSTGDNVLRRMKTSWNEERNLLSKEGIVAIDPIGSVNVSYEKYSYQLSEITLFSPLETTYLKGQGGAVASLTFMNTGLMRLLLDQNGDGTYNLGRYFIVSSSDYSEGVPWLSNYNVEDYPLVDINDLNHPPIFKDLDWVNGRPSKTFGTEVYFGENWYFDVDNPQDDLSHGIEWSVDGQVIDDAKDQTTLDTKHYDYGSRVQVKLTISDGHSTVSKILQETVDD